MDSYWRAPDPMHARLQAREYMHYGPERRLLARITYGMAAPELWSGRTRTVQRAELL